MRASGTDRAADDDALARRLRDDDAATRRLDDLRGAAYGRDASAAPLVAVPAVLREATGIEDAALPAPLIALLTEEVRLVAEGRALLDGERRASASPARAAVTAAAGSAGPASADADGDGDADTDADTDSDADADASTADEPPTTAPAAQPDDAPPARADRRIRPGVLVAAVTAALALGGLLGASGSGLLDDAVPAAAPTASSPADGRGSRVEAMGTPDGRRASAVPPFTASPPPHVSATDEEMAAVYRREADASWELLASGVPGAVRPEVALERVVSEEDFPEQQVECLRAAGIEASVVGGGGITYQDADPVEVWSCYARFPMQQPDPRTDAELAYEHDYLVSFLLPCYAVAGRPYTDAVPGREEYVARAKAGDPWSPIPDGMDGALSSRCPAQPPAWG
ncbi:hypothetical protein FGG90_07810 [Clavibacter tessellarius]|uniref:Uncharacterized protein n=1 Tax=Clavibacter tessellarius TaxID=31965 RepID=A0A225CBH0_9MICO|nr:hypothetical protein [Clavibacter michiganensis]OQJ63100.1 hypothetical protein B5P24_08910 [Clavibacter michiganensis subsp. tessellarius]UKF33917.1 hypothetical protein FGG90_07810 [Clavibacter michiganensis subsp. tessellarius]